MVLGMLVVREVRGWGRWLWIVVVVVAVDWKELGWLVGNGE